MKKILTVLLTISMILALSLTAFAENPIVSSGGSDSANVKGTYKGSGSAVVYSVDITWGSMEFTYNDAGGTWNPATHTYDGAGTASWTCNTDANKVAVTNHSNSGVTAAFTYTKGASYSAINGSFSSASFNLKTAEGTLPASAPSNSTLLTLSGALASGTAANTVIGSVTVTIS